MTSSTPNTHTAPSRARPSLKGWESLLGLDDAKNTWNPDTGSNLVKEAVLYLRVSTPRQMTTAIDIDADGNSIATQRESTTARSLALNAPINREFVEPGNSAQTIAKRPVFREMLHYLEAHPEVGYVLIHTRSRAFRNQTDAAITKRILAQMGVILVSAKEEFGQGYMADAMEAITDVMNEVQSRANGEDIAGKLHHKASQGGTIGRAKLGYLNVRKNFDGIFANTIDIDEERAPLIQWAFEAYATGEYTLVELGEELTRQGLRTRPSRKWKAQPLSHSQLAQILHDPYYTGMLRYKKTQLFQGRHEALISNELFLKVQAVLAERAKRGQRDRTHHQFLKGLLWCGHCHDAARESRLVFSENKGNGGTYQYYICRGRQDGLCDASSMPLAEVEEAITRAIAQLQLPEDFITSIRDQLDDTLATSQASDQAMRTNLQKQLKALGIKEERLLDLAADSQLDTPTLKKRLHTIAIEKAAIHDKLSHTTDHIEHGIQTLHTLLDLLQNPAALYQNSNENIRRLIIEAFYIKLLVTITDYNITVAGTLQNSIQRLEDAADAFEANKKGSSGRKAETSSMSTSSAALTTVLQVEGVSKTDVVGLTGFEPATP